jgi:hypothetical protein
VASGNFAWVVIDFRGQAVSHSALREAVRKLRNTHVEIPIVVFSDARSAPQLGRDAAQFGLTLASAPGVLISDLIAVRGER